MSIKIHQDLPNTKNVKNINNACALGEIIQKSQINANVAGISCFALGIIFLLSGILLLAYPLALPVISTVLGALCIGIGAALFASSISLCVLKKPVFSNQIMNLSNKLKESYDALICREKEIKALSSKVRSQEEEILKLKKENQHLEACILEQQQRMHSELDRLSSEVRCLKSQQNL